jgi:phosphoglycolate phosphatase
MDIVLAASPAKMRRFLGPPLRHGLHALLGLTGAELDAAVGIYREYYRERGLFEAECYPGIRELLPELRSAGATICLATSKYSVMAEKMMEHFGLRPLLDHMAMSEGSERRSAKKDMLLEVLAACGTRPGQAVMVGDTMYDAEGAREAGTEFIGVLYGYGTREEMEQAGGRLFAADAAELKKMLFV